MTKTKMTEAQIRKAARRIARKAQQLRAKGQHEAADAMVNQAMQNVEAMRARGEVG